MRYLRYYFILLFFFTAKLGMGQNPNGYDTAWYNSYGGSNIDYGSDIKETSDKGFIIAGNTSSFGSGNTSFYAIKTDSLGRKQWSQSYGTTANDLSTSVELAADGGYWFTGYTNYFQSKGYDAYVVKTDKNGNVLWHKNYGGADWDFIYGSCKLPDEGLVLCGKSYSKPNGYNAWLIRLNAMGDTLWQKKYGVSGNDVFNSVKYYNNRLYVAGSSLNTGTKKLVATFFKMNLTGNIESSHSYAGDSTKNYVYRDLVLTSTGELLFGGSIFNDTLQCLLRKVDSSTYAQNQILIHKFTSGFTTVIEGAGGDYYAAGPSQGFNQNGKSILTYRYGTNFAQLNYYFFGGKHDEDVSKIIRTSKGGYAIIGVTTTFGNTNNSKIENVFLAITNRPNLSQNYFELVSEYVDELSPVNLEQTKNSACEGFKIYPNPFSDKITITSCENINNFRIELFSSIGKKLTMQTSYPIMQNAHLVLNTSQLKPGVYVLKLFEESGKIKSQIIVKE